MIQWLKQLPKTLRCLLATRFERAAWELGELDVFIRRIELAIQESRSEIEVTYFSFLDRSWRKLTATSTEDLLDQLTSRRRQVETSLISALKEDR